MIKPKQSIAEIKRMVNACAGSRLSVCVNLGRNKSMRFQGKLSGVYPAVFTVEPDEKDFLGRTAYSYSDVLCGTVKIRKV